MSAILKDIFIYPIKSLDGIGVSRSEITEGGALAHDREFALRAANGVLVNGKRFPLVHAIRSEFDMDRFTVTLKAPQSTETFHLGSDTKTLGEWFSDALAEVVSIERNQRSGFPDDTTAWGPTIISDSSLRAVSSWFPGITIEEARRRFRPNLVMSGVPPFWEDRLFQEIEQPLLFQLGDISFEGINPCQRCPVPTKHPDTGIVTEGFQKTFIERRSATLPPWAALERFNHFYRLSVNTRIPTSEAGKILKVGDISSGVV